MPKRKRSDIEDKTDNISDRAIRIKASRLYAKIDHGNQSLKTALNLARGFERQKLGRRQKQASNEPHVLLRLREEVIVLKELDLAQAASSYLFKQLVRTKRIKESDAFVAVFGSDPKTATPNSKAEANVLGRLFKANPVQEVLPGILSEIKQVLSLDDLQGINKSDRRIQNDRAPVTSKEEAEIPVRVENTDLSGFPDEISLHNSSEHTLSDGDPSEVEFDRYDNRLAGSSDELESTGSSNELHSIEVSDVETDNDDAQNSGSLNSRSRTAEEDIQIQVQDKTPAPVGKATSTAFLPSLSMGGYYSGSESDEEEEHQDRQHGPALLKERKNRRGQRERQKLAELKYGDNAKHLQKQSKNKDSRDAGWDAKRGAVSNMRNGSKQRRFERTKFSNSKRPTGANSEALVGDRRSGKVGKAKKEDGPIHPSWEAARKRKQESGNAAFVGKKITFD